MDIAIFKERMYDIITRLSDPEYQQRAWLDDNLPNVIDSPYETLCQLYDSLNARENVPKFIQSDELRLNILELLNNLDLIEEEEYEHEGFFQQPRWRDIISRSARIKLYIEVFGWDSSSVQN